MNKKQIPNYLSIGRGIAVLLALAVMVWMPAAHQLIFWIFAIAAASDYLDGYLARKWKATSDFGAMFDQISDKLLVVLTLIYLLKLDRTWIMMLPISIIILRELYVSGLREFLALKKIALPVSKGGKLENRHADVIGRLHVIWHRYGVPPVWSVGRMLLLVAAVLALYSALEYTQKVLEKIR